MWRDFDLTQRIITLKEQESKTDIHYKSDFNGAVARASGSHWTPVVTVPRPFSMTIREDALKTTKTQGRFCTVLLARLKLSKRLTYIFSGL